MTYKSNAVFKNILILQSDVMPFFPILIASEFNLFLNGSHTICLSSSLSNSQSVVGLLALYTLALKSSCYDLNTVTFNVGKTSGMLLTHLKKQMEQEKDHIACKFPLTFGGLSTDIKSVHCSI